MSQPVMDGQDLQEVGAMFEFDFSHSYITSYVDIDVALIDLDSLNLDSYSFDAAVAPFKTILQATESLMSVFGDTGRSSEISDGG